MPNGKGGYHTILLYLDTFTQWVWSFEFKTAGMAKTTVGTLGDIFTRWTPAEVHMSHGSSHFKKKEVAACCAQWGVQQHVVAAYSPWINGPIEGTNKILLYVLARLCAPDVGEDVWSKTKWDNLPKKGVGSGGVDAAIVGVSAWRWPPGGGDAGLLRPVWCRWTVFVGLVTTLVCFRRQRTPRRDSRAPLSPDPSRSPGRLLVESF
jgi:transposase InsO family protein